MISRKIMAMGLTSAMLAAGLGGASEASAESRYNGAGRHMLNPQPLPPGSRNSLNPQPLPPGSKYMINPQPLPPRVSGKFGR